MPRWTGIHLAHIVLLAEKSLTPEGVSYTRSYSFAERRGWAIIGVLGFVSQRSG